VTNPFQTRKSVHVNLTTGTHAELRVSLFKRNLSMQEVFEHLACSIVDGDSYLNNLLDTLEYNKKYRVNTKQIVDSDSETIFEEIKANNTLGED